MQCAMFEVVEKPQAVDSVRKRINIGASYITRLNQSFPSQNGQLRLLSITELPLTYTYQWCSFAPCTLYIQTFHPIMLWVDSFIMFYVLVLNNDDIDVQRIKNFDTINFDRTNLQQTSLIHL